MEQAPTILVVDDDEFLSDMLEDLFSESGWRVLTAESAPRACELLAENPVDVVLTDLNLSSGSGFDILELLTEGSMPLPTILMTAFVSDEVCRRARELGAYATLSKPFHTGEALGAAQRALRDIIEHPARAPTRGSTAASPGK